MSDDNDALHREYREARVAYFAAEDAIKKLARLFQDAHEALVPLRGSPGSTQGHIMRQGGGSWIDDIPSKDEVRAAVDGLALAKKAVVDAHNRLPISEQSHAATLPPGVDKRNH